MSQSEHQKMSNILHEQRGQDGINVNDLLKQVRSTAYDNDMDD